MDLQETSCEDVDSIQLAKHRVSGTRKEIYDFKYAKNLLTR